MFELAVRGDDGKLFMRPAYKTFQWLATTFGSRPYRSLHVHADPSAQVKAVALQMKDSGDTYLAVWQDGVADSKGAITPESVRDVNVSIDDLKDASVSLQPLDLDGKPSASPTVAVDRPFQIKVTLPEISATSESGIYLAKITQSVR
jgi:hypothetical protein